MPGHFMFMDFVKAHQTQIMQGAATGVLTRYVNIPIPGFPFLDRDIGQPAAVAWAMGGFQEKDHAIAGAVGSAAVVVAQMYLPGMIGG